VRQPAGGGPSAVVFTTEAGRVLVNAALYKGIKVVLQVGPACTSSHGAAGALALAARRHMSLCLYWRPACMSTCGTADALAPAARPHQRSACSGSASACEAGVRGVRLCMARSALQDRSAQVTVFKRVAHCRGVPSCGGCGDRDTVLAAEKASVVECWCLLPLHIQHIQRRQQCSYISGMR